MQIGKEDNVQAHDEENGSAQSDGEEYKVETLLPDMPDLSDNDYVGSDAKTEEQDEVKKSASPTNKYVVQMVADAITTAHDVSKSKKNENGKNNNTAKREKKM